MTQHDVVIAGGGPTGLMLAGELALAGVDVVVVERRTDQRVDGSRAGGLHARTIEVLDQRGIADRFVSAGTKHPGVGYAMVMLDLGDFPSRHNYTLGLWQRDFEPILAGWVDELAVPVRRGHEVVGVAQDDDGVDVALSDGSSLRARYLVGCDGGRSLVRRSAGIEFVGAEPSTSWMIAEVDMDGEPIVGMRDGNGIGPIDPTTAGGPYRVLLLEPGAGESGDPGFEELRSGLIRVYGTDFGLRRASWISRFTDMARQAAAYRAGRVLLAGDAAHVHPPQGGQGLNVGVQDAVNLGWKLAQVVRGASPDALLDTYHRERHPVGARVLHNTMAQVAIGRQDERHQALRETLGELLAFDEPRRMIAGMISGLDVRYDLGGVHPLVGRRIPDLDLQSAAGPLRMFTLLHDARGVLVNFGEPGACDVAGWTSRVRLVDARGDGAWELPVIGEVPAPPAVLIRPDGHVAWVGEAGAPDLAEALTTWFGCPSGVH